jgi:hypothetical protein
LPSAPNFLIALLNRFDIASEHNTRKARSLFSL